MKLRNKAKQLGVFPDTLFQALDIKPHDLDHWLTVKEKLYITNNEKHIKQLDKELFYGNPDV